MVIIKGKHGYTKVGISAEDVRNVELSVWQDSFQASKRLGGLTVGNAEFACGTTEPAAYYGTVE